MLFKTSEKTHIKQTQLSAEEAHRLWAKTQSRYIFIENILFLSNFIHDLDFKVFLIKLQGVYQKEAKELEDQLKKYSIKSPKPNKTNIEILVNKETITDQQIARNIYSFAQLALSKCVKSLHDATLNEDIRELLLKIIKEEVNTFYELVDYLKLKGWLDNPPLYPNIKGNKIVAANEIWELWQHLYYRYIHRQRTRDYIKHVRDIDFLAILKIGETLLEKQIEKIENLLISFGIALPDQYPKNIPTPESKERYDDELIFHSLLSSMKNATVIHGFALQEIIINDDIRNLFRSLLFDEIDIINKITKYGKLKGWVPLVPVYRV